jgi:VIT1/CCC1 family predicted Fe2+/Mn2+ transporter
MANAPIEQKVKSATAATFVVALLLAVLNSVVADSSLLNPLPAWLQALVIPVVPALVTFLAGWQAKHSPRVE